MPKTKHTSAMSYHCKIVIKNNKFPVIAEIAIQHCLFLIPCRKSKASILITQWVQQWTLEGLFNSRQILITS